MDFSQELVNKITWEHSTFPDLVALARVSRSWRSAALDRHNLSRKHLQSTPGLLLHTELLNYPLEFVPFFSVSSMLEALNKKNPNLPPPPTLSWSPPPPTAASLRFQCAASKDGWLVLIKPTAIGRGVLVHLFNPITGASINLPQLKNFTPKDIAKFILSSSPEEQDCRVFILFHSAPRLASYKIGGGNWGFSTNSPIESVEDAAFSAGKLYILDGQRNCVHVLDCNLITTAVITIAPIMTILYNSTESMKFRHIAFDLNGQLLILIRHRSKDFVRFRIYRRALEQYWEEVKSLEGYALFLGNHESLCRPSDDKVRSNSIYFAFHCSKYHQNDAFWRWHINDCGICTLGDQMLQRFSPAQHRNRLFIWFLPMPFPLHTETEEEDHKNVNCSDGDEHDESVYAEEDEGHGSTNNKFQALLLLDDDSLNV